MKRKKKVTRKTPEVSVPDVMENDDCKMTDVGNCNAFTRYNLFYVSFDCRHLLQKKLLYEAVCCSRYLSVFLGVFRRFVLCLLQQRSADRKAIQAEIMSLKRSKEKLNSKLPHEKEQKKKITAQIKALQRTAHHLVAKPAA